MTQSEFSPLFTEEYFDREHHIFKRELLTDTSEGNKQRLQQLSRLFFSLLSSPDVNLVGSTLARDLLNLELKEIEKIYPNAKRQELLTKMECAAASVLDDFSCGIKFWEKINTSTFISLTADTVLMPTLVAADFISAGAYSSSRNIAKVAQKKGNKILAATVKGYKYAHDKVWSASKAIHRITRFEKLKLTKGYSAINYVIGSKGFELTMKIVKLAAEIKEGLADLTPENKQLMARMLTDLNVEIEGFRSDCNDRFSDEACLYFEGLNKDQLSKAADSLLTTGLGGIDLVITALDIKLVAMGYALIENAMINPLTDNKDNEFLLTLRDTGFQLAEFLPIAGPVATWGNSIAKTKEEMSENFSAVRYEFELFSMAEAELTKVALARYQAAIIEDTIFAVINSPNDIAYQLLNRDILYPRTLNKASLLEVFSINSFSVLDYRSVMNVIADKKESCDPHKDGRDIIILFNTDYFVDIYRCKMLHFTSKNEPEVSVVYDLLNNTINLQFNQIFSDIYPSSEYAIAVGSLVTKGILDNKNTNFYPKKYITRAEFYAIVQRAFFLQTSYNVTEVWSLNSLNILKQNLPNISINEALDEPITVSEVGKLLAGSTNIKSNLGFLAERHYGQACSALEPSLFKLLANDYLLVQKNSDIACPYRIYNGSKLTRGDAAILIANALEGVE